MELRFNIDDSLIERLQGRTNISKGSELAREAFGLLDWATQQNQAGRHVAASDNSGNHYVPVTPVVNHFPYAGE